jgi:hypothetical protein
MADLLLVVLMMGLILTTVWIAGACERLKK